MSTPHHGWAGFGVVSQMTDSSPNEGARIPRHVIHIPPPNFYGLVDRQDPHIQQMCRSLEAMSMEPPPQNRPIRVQPDFRRRGMAFQPQSMERFRQFCLANIDHILQLTPRQRDYVLGPNFRRVFPHGLPHPNHQRRYWDQCRMQQQRQLEREAAYDHLAATTNNNLAIFKEDAFKCPVCWDPMAVPKMMTCCGRSLCHTCERNHRRNGYPKCPFCGTRNNRDRFQELPVNVSLRNAMEVIRVWHKERPICEGCRNQVDNLSLLSCKDCNSMKICKHCFRAHHDGHHVEQACFVSKDVRIDMIQQFNQQINNLDHSASSSVKLITCAVASVKTQITQIMKNIEENDTLTENDIKMALNQAKRMIENHREIHDKVAAIVRGMKFTDDVHTSSSHPSVS